MKEYNVMQKTLEGAEAIVRVSDGNQTTSVQGIIKSVFVLSQGSGNDTFLILEFNGLEHFLNVNYIVNITVLKPKKVKPTKEPIEDRMVT
jgi:hypothetical protein